MSLAKNISESRNNILVDSGCDGIPTAALQSAWEHLLVGSASSEKIFQTPAYFQFICNNPDQHSAYRVCYVKHEARDEIKGLIPTLIGHHNFKLQVKHLKVMQVRVPMVMLLGSMPLVPNESELLDDAVHGLFTHFSSCSCLYMQAIPFDSQFHQHIVSSQYIQKKYFVFVKDGWRRCHITRLPASFAAYQESLKTKRRYNVKRQIRNLAAEAGEVGVQPIEVAASVPALMRALERLTGAEHPDFLNEAQYTELAQKNILLSYVMRCGNNPVAAMVGIRSERNFMVHKIIYDPAFAKHSPGTSIVYLATEDLIDRLGLSLIDYGFGASKQLQRWPDRGELRGQLFLFKRTFGNLALISIYKLFMNFVSLSKRIYANKGDAQTHFFFDPY
jgi:hypothetical protein